MTVTVEENPRSSGNSDDRETEQRTRIQPIHLPLPRESHPMFKSEVLAPPITRAKILRTILTDDMMGLLPDFAGVHEGISTDYILTRIHFFSVL